MADFRAASRSQRWRVEHAAGARPGDSSGRLPAAPAFRPPQRSGPRLNRGIRYFRSSNPGLVIPDNPDAVGSAGPWAVGSASLWAVGRDAVFSEQQIDYLKKDIPLRRLTTAEDIASTVTWISSEPAARQIIRQVLSVSGGYTMP